LSDSSIVKIPVQQARMEALDRYQYEDLGYNKVEVVSDNTSIIETFPGYSKEASRCCPDRPAIQAIYRINGKELTLSGVKELESI